MSDTDTAPPRSNWRLPRERDRGFVAGVVLFVFVVTHLLNHAIGVFGVRSMEAVQAWRVLVWQYNWGRDCSMAPS